MTPQLRATPFKGDPDVEDLHTFFLPDQQFDGDTLWSFGTSLESAYVNMFEFMNHAPVVQLWRDESETVQAVSRISLGTGEWFHLAKPAYRTEEVTEQILTQADSALALLTDRTSWQTVRYESKTDEIQHLERYGYRRSDIAEVYMTRPLGDHIERLPCPEGVGLRLLDPANPGMVHERAMAQIDAFSAAEPTAAAAAWISRSLPHQLRYGGTGNNSSVVAIDDAGTILAFADPFFDRTNLIGEFEPVGTRKSAQRKGLSKIVLTRGLAEMHDNGMRLAVVRTDFDNHAAIAAYESVGFKITDHLIRFRKERLT